MSQVLGLWLVLFLVARKNKEKMIDEKVEILFEMIKTNNIENITYEEIRNKPLTPEYV